MITIKYDPDKLSMEITGHSGRAAAGEDLVCCAVSALSYALETHFYVKQDYYRAEIVRDDGTPVFSVKANPVRTHLKRCRESFETIMDGMRLIREYYPENVKIIEGGNDT